MRMSFPIDHEELLRMECKESGVYIKVNFYKEILVIKQ